MPPKIKLPKIKLPKIWNTPPGDYCWNCDTHGSRKAEQKGNVEERTCNDCGTKQSYTTR